MKFPQHNMHLINGNFDLPQPGVKAPKHTKTAMPISLPAFPSPLRIGLENIKAHQLSL